MSGFWEMVVSNSLMVCLLAAGIALIGRVWRNPAALHALWLLLLVKLFLPPVFTTHLPIGAPETAAMVESAPEPASLVIKKQMSGQRASPRASNAGTTGVALAQVAATSPHKPPRSIAWAVIVATVWIAGGIVMLSSYTFRIARFRRLIRVTTPAPEVVIESIARIAAHLRLTHAPPVRMTNLCVTPLVWSFARSPVVILPTELLARLSKSACEAVLIHELAHIERRDHLVRYFEMLVTTLFWWHPVVWFACHRLRELEEECCDQAVVASAPGQARVFASTLVDTIDFLAQAPPRPVPLTTAIDSTGVIARRIRLLQQRRTSRVSPWNVAVIGALMVPPLAIGFAANAQETSDQKAAANGAARIVGEVVNEQGQPIADALVRVSIPAEDMRFVTDSHYETHSNAGGRFEVVLEGLGLKTTASVDAFAPGYRRLSDALMTATRTLNLEIVPGEKAEASLVLMPGFYLKGTVVNEAGEPVPGVSIGASTNALRIVDGKEQVYSSAGVERTTSREDGTFEIFNYALEPRTRDAKPEKGHVGFFHEDYVPAHIDDVYALPAEERTKLRITLPTGSSAAGQVVDSDGKPVSNVMVEVLATDGNRDKATLTDAHGQFEFEGLMEQPATFRVHAMALRQKVALPVDLSQDQKDLELRLQPITITIEPEMVEVLDMQLTDITPELKSRYDLHHDGGALILNPGTDSDRLAVGELREGYAFWMVGQQRVGSVREFVQALVEEAKKLPASRRQVRVVYTFRDLRMVGTNTQYMKLTDDDMRQLEAILATLQ